MLINVSPIEYGHVLLCPRVLDCLPQNLNPSTARLALHFALEVSNPYLRVGFNSLGAFATINHLHFQAYYLAAPLPCERAPMRPLRLKSGSNGSSSVAAVGGGDAPQGEYHPVSISYLTEYPVRGWVVEGPSLAGMAQVREWQEERGTKGQKEQREGERTEGGSLGRLRGSLDRV